MQLWKHLNRVPVQRIINLAVYKMCLFRVTTEQFYSPEISQAFLRYCNHDSWSFWIHGYPLVYIVGILGVLGVRRTPE
jgi:hypothetical protein